MRLYDVIWVKYYDIAADCIVVDIIKAERRGRRSLRFSPGVLLPQSAAQPAPPKEEPDIASLQYDKAHHAVPPTIIHSSLLIKKSRPWAASLIRLSFLQRLSFQRVSL